MASDSRFVSQRAYARHRGVNVNAVTEAIRSKRLSASLVLDDQGVRKISSVEAADAEWDRNTDAQRRINAAGGVDVRAAITPPASDDGAPAWESKARLTAAQADLAEIKLQRERAELVLAADVRREWADLLSSARTKMLTIPTLLKQAIPTLSVADVVLVEDLIRSALEDLVAAEVGE